MQEGFCVWGRASGMSECGGLQPSSLPVHGMKEFF